jgi:hypothetical protein
MNEGAQILKAMHEAEARDDKEAMRALLRKQGGRLLETVRAPPGAAMSPFNPEHVEGDFLTDRATWQGLGPVHKDGTPHCWSCALGNLLTPATHLALDLKDGKEAPSWRFLCTKDQERWAESYPGVPVFEIRRPALDLGNVDEALPEGKPEPATGYIQNSIVHWVGLTPRWTSSNCGRRASIATSPASRISMASRPWSSAAPWNPATALRSCPTSRRPGPRIG